MIFMKRKLVYFNMKKNILNNFKNNNPLNPAVKLVWSLFTDSD